MSIRHAARFLLALLLATFVMLAVRAFAFTIYTVPDKGWEPDFHQGDRVIVNKLDRVPVKKHDLIAFTDSAGHVCFVGRVEAVPGNIIRCGENFYRIPYICCKRCRCPDCKLYEVRIGHRHILVHKHQIIGKVYRLYHFGF